MYSLNNYIEKTPPTLEYTDISYVVVAQMSYWAIVASEVISALMSSPVTVVSCVVLALI
jgi:hypothetical protein